uniref:Uncharacterized protein n=1 Tax=Setaria italica TaxID=4555 RepID=K3ZBS8_SETIT
MCCGLLLRTQCAVILFPVKFFVIFLEQRISSFELWILVVRFLFLLCSILLHL